MDCKKTNRNKILFVAHLPEDITKNEMKELEFEENFIEQSIFVDRIRVLRNKLSNIGIKFLLSNNVDILSETDLNDKELIIICGVKLDDLIKDLQQKVERVIVVSNYSYMYCHEDIILSVYIQNLVA